MRKSLRLLAASTLAMAAFWACGDDGSGPDPVASITVDPAVLTLAVGESQALSATPRDGSGSALSGRSVTFTSGDEDVITVTQAGLVTAVGEGSTTVTVASEGASVQVPVTVTPAPVASVAVAPDPLELVEGETGTLTVTLEDALGNELTGRQVSFQSGNEAVATVDQSGEVTAVGEGQTMVTATSEGQSGQATVIVSPVPVATVEVEPADLDLVVGEQQAITVTLRDADGNELAGRVVTFESGDEAVATVDGDGVVTGAGVGSTTVTVSSEGQSAQVAVDVDAPPFEPTEDTEVDGDRTFGSVDIPAGVTVTVTADAVIHSLGAVNMAGSVMSDCREVQVIADGPVTVSGTVDTRCTTDPGADGSHLRIVGTGAMTFTGSTVASQGDLTVTNDSTLTLEDFAAAELMGVPVRPLARAASGPCSYNEISSPTRPKPATPNTAGKSGANGKGGRTTRWICDGDADFDGGTYEGQDAGDGEDGTAEASDDSQGPAEGGDGGDADEMRVLSSGSMTFTGGTTINLGDGGHGGDAQRVAPPNRAAEATGGNGGMSGTLTVRAGGGISIPQMGGLIIDIGRPGDGGDAEAVGGKGDDSSAGEDAKPGGNATATGGEGGSTPPAQFRSSGNVSGIGNITLTGGPAGQGGEATARGGQGGHGAVQERPDGAKGGDQTATGGKGGEAPAGDFDGNPFVVAGNGGDAELFDGVGGTGFDMCPPLISGGDGGVGGNGTARGGARGTIGLTSGAQGEAFVATGAGDGGDGGDGVGPGEGGSGGAEDAQDGQDPPPAAVTDNDPNYEDGDPGRLCIVVEDDELVVEHIVSETSCPQLVGTITVTNPYDQSISVTLTPSVPFLDVVPQSAGIPAGGSAEFEVYFNCETTTSFTAEVAVSGMSADGFEILSVAVPVSVSISFPLS